MNQSSHPSKHHPKEEKILHFVLFLINSRLRGFSNHLMSCRCSFSMVSAGKFIKNVSFNRQTTIFLSTRQTVKGLFSNKIFTELSEIQWNKFYGPWRKFHKKWKSADWSPDYFEQHYFTLYWIGVFLLSIFLEGFNEFISLLVRERIFCK